MEIGERGKTGVSALLHVIVATAQEREIVIIRLRKMEVLAVAQMDPVKKNKRNVVQNLALLHNQQLSLVRNQTLSIHSFYCIHLALLCILSWQPHSILQTTFYSLPVL